MALFISANILVTAFRASWSYGIGVAGTCRRINMNGQLRKRPGR